MIFPRTFSHIGLSVTDLDKAVKFYTEVFDIKLLRQKDYPAGKFTNAFIGFAGQDVIRQTVRENLPEGFQRSEFLLDHGAIDMIIDRRKMREEIADLLAKFKSQPSPVPAS